MPPSWHPVPACTPRRRCRRAVFSCSSEGAAVIPKSGLEIKNRYSLWAILEGFLASILKSGLEIKNRCSLWAILEGFLASIPKSGPEIKNHCTLEGVSWQKPAVIPKSGLEIKNRCIGGVLAFCRRNHSPLRQRRLESDAEDRCRNDCCRRAILLCGNGD